VRDRMESCYELSVPLVVDVGTGKSWGAAKS
jgi:DNA polymerase I-like protein with 3'-5' exonuclease and polymerase domains